MSTRETMSENLENNLVFKRERSENGTEWELYSSEYLPEECIDDPRLCSSVICVAIMSDERILLSEDREKGWGVLGGHIELKKDGSLESPEEAAIREALEEGGFKPNNPHLFGYIKASSPEPVVHQDGDKYYPWPIGYLPCYWSQTNKRLIKPKDEDVIDVKSFTIEEIRELHIKDLVTIELGWHAYLKYKEKSKL